jgi:hypothetical protein
MLGSAMAAGFAVAGAPAQAAPAQVQAAPGWHYIGDFTTQYCYSRGDWYVANGARSYRCDWAGPNVSSLWVLTDG